MGLKPSFLPLVFSVMEHEQGIIREAEMLLKEPTTFPDGSPLIESYEDSGIKDLPPPPVFSTNGINGSSLGTSMGTTNSTDVQKPLHVHINGFNKLPLDESPRSMLSLSLASTSLPTPATLDSSPAVAPLGDIRLPTAKAITEALSHVNTTSRQSSDSPKVVSNDGHAQSLPVSGPPSTRMVPSHPSGSRVPLPMYNPAVPGPSRKDIEANKRKALCDKVQKHKDQKDLDFFVPQCEGQSVLQMAIMMKRFKSSAASLSVLPSYISNDIFDEEEPAKKALRMDAGPSGGAHDELTDISDVEEYEDNKIDTYQMRWGEQKVRLGGLYTRTSQLLEQRKARLKELEVELSRIRGDECEHRVIIEEPSTLRDSADEAEIEESSQTCARIRRLLHVPKRKLVRFELQEKNRFKVDYSTMEPSTSTERFSKADTRVHPEVSFPEDVPIDRRMEAHLHWLSMVPSMTVRRAMDQSIYLNKQEVAEEKQRNGWKRAQEKEQRRQKMEEKEKAAEKEQSSDYEDTDPEDVYEPKAERRKASVKNNKKKRRGSVKRGRGRPPKEGQLPAAAITKVPRRSTANSTRQSRQFECEDMYSYIDAFGCGPMPLLAKIDYKEIPVPPWHKMTDEQLAEYETSGPCSCCESNLLIEVAKKHHIHEFEEKMRFKFKACREKTARDQAQMAGKLVQGLVTLDQLSSGQNTPQPIELQAFDPSVIEPQPPSEIYSIAKPYSPRQFI